MRSEPVGDGDRWRTPLQHPPLPKQEVHVWQVDLDLSPAYIDLLTASLSPDERDRADRFRFAQDRSRFIAARGQLRAVLGRYLMRPPEEVRLSYSEYGKPRLENDASLYFNISHSQSLALFAFTQCGAVGVDVERIRYDASLDQVARTVFAPGEIETLHAAASEERAFLFFRYWTGKEACVKAVGAGLSLPLTGFQICLESDRVEWLHSPDARPEGFPDRIQALAPAPGYAAALAVAGAVRPLTLWRME